MKFRQDVAQRSPEWHNLRMGKITGTTLASILGTPAARKKALWETVAELLTVPDENAPEYETPMQRGTRLEPDAIAEFEFETGYKTCEVGFVEGDIPLSGQSPDAYLALEDGTVDVTRAVEVKCLGSTNHLLAVLANEVPSEYKPQATKYFVDNHELQTLYFVLYNPQMPRFRLHTIEVHRADILSDITEASTALAAFSEEVLNELERVITISEKS